MKMNKYLRYWSIILLFIGLLFFCDNGQLVHAQDNNSVISNDEIKEIIRVSTHSYIVSSEEISNKVKSSTSGYEIKLDDLIEKGYISDEKLKNFETNKDINTKNVTIIVTYGLNDEGTAYEYQYQINGIK